MHLLNLNPYFLNYPFLQDERHESHFTQMISERLPPLASLSNRSHAYLHFFWILSTIKMKFGNYQCAIVSSRVETPFFLREPHFFWSKLKVTPSFWEPSKLVHVNCMKHFKMKVLHFVLSQLIISLSLLSILSSSTLNLLLTLSLVKYCL